MDRSGCRQGSGRIALIGVPMECGANQPGPALGPAAFRSASIREAFRQGGVCIEDCGDVVPSDGPDIQVAVRRFRLDEVARWTRALKQVADDALSAGSTPVFLGGDHSMSAGTVAGASAFAAKVQRPLFVLWMDAHPDFNTLRTTRTGNLHGVPVAFFCGLPGFEQLLGGPLETPVRPSRVMVLGARSIDPEEHDLLARSGAKLHEMRNVRKAGIVAHVQPFLEEVSAANGLLHVSLDVDFLDPEVAPGTGTKVPGGATVEEAQDAMELLRESGLVSSLDVAELNPLLDENNRTSDLMVDLAARLFGGRGVNRQARSCWSRAA